MADHGTKIGGQVRLGKRPIGNGAPAFLIGEVGSNHNRDLILAKRLIEAAAQAGVDAVKFQSFRAEWLYPSNCGSVDTPMGNVDFFSVLQDSQLPVDWLGQLKRYAEACGLIFLSTPFDEQAVRDLHEIGVPALKIASAELNHLPLLRAAARTGLPLLASTGMCTLSDIEEALQTIRGVNPNADVALFHCVAGYPTPLDQCNLGVIDTLRRAFGVPVGYSDHTTDFQLVPATAVAVGACILEKHFTLDRTLPGPDHPFALEPCELRELVGIVRETEQLEPERRLPALRDRFGANAVKQVLGHGRKEIMPVEVDIYPCDKRSIHAVRPIQAGEKLSTENIRVLRSERNLTPGLHSRHWETVLGAQTTAAIALGEGIQWDHLISRIETVP